jgi:hypothetical protein
MNPDELEAIVEAKVKAILADMLGLNTPAGAAQRQWYGAKDAIAHLDLDQEEELHRARRAGLLVEGTHYRQTNSPDAGIPRYQYHVEAMAAWLNSPAAKRYRRR